MLYIKVIPTPKRNPEAEHHVWRGASGASYSLSLGLSFQPLRGLPAQATRPSTLAAILTPANDVERWKVKYEAEIVGYVYDGKPESVNCGALVLDRDTHVELVLTGPCFTSFLSRHYRPRTSPSNVPCRCRERGWLPKLYAELISPVPGAREQSSGSSSG